MSDESNASDEYERPGWLSESIAQLESVRVERPVSAPELRRRSVRRRQRRTRSVAVAAIAVTAIGAGAFWSSVGANRSAETPSHHEEDSRTSAAQENLRTYYSVLPDVLAARGATSKSQLWKLMTEHFTETALKREVVLEGSGSDDLAATCGHVTATTVFTVGAARSAGADTVRVHVTSDSAPDSIEVEVDLRSLRISNWSCPEGS
ncbi:hypothetical protein JHN63_13845 [Streptomyces sp. MBT65]|uniref:hypothetical protein n=1 Tax=Streptomyces sp. MBT65 TaxID=1488395 RepID=UPI001909AA20|nr:hypothetical protein [Streptomyces sp. MBT65]MBK3574879.1 hypothetical protein [Streptomyces sp. MBT65]